MPRQPPHNAIALVPNPTTPVNVSSIASFGVNFSISRPPLSSWSPPPLSPIFKSTQFIGWNFRGFINDLVRPVCFDCVQHEHAFKKSTQFWNSHYFWSTHDVHTAVRDRSPLSWAFRSLYWSASKRSPWLLSHSFDIIITTAKITTTTTTTATTTTKKKWEKYLFWRHVPRFARHVSSHSSRIRFFPIINKHETHPWNQRRNTNRCTHRIVHQHDTSTALFISRAWLYPWHWFSISRKIKK